MSRSKKILVTLITIFVILIAITIFFITKHSVIGMEAKINETVKFENITIELDSLVLYNFERKAYDFNIQNNKFKYMILSNLPQSLIMPYLRVQYLYSIPYEISNEYYQTAVFGKCIFNKNSTAATDYFDNFKDSIKITVLDSVGAAYNSGSRTSLEDNSQEIDFSIKGDDFPSERLHEGIKVIVKHLETGEEKEFQIDFQDFTTYKHNDSFKKVFPFPYEP